MNSEKSFDDSKYFDRVFEEANIDSKTYKKIQKAFKLAHDVRKFEIELFWKRGTYFWAFILASFTTYFVIFNVALCGNELSLCTLIELSGFAKTVLLVAIGITFVFCLSWVLVNKGSKFWQKNWEAHIDMLEDTISGKLYKTFLNTNNSTFKRNPLSKEAYDYSVTQITTIGSIILMCMAACLFIFHFLLCFSCFWYGIWDSSYILIIIALSIAVMLVVAIFYLVNCVGNKSCHNKTNKWYQRKKSG